MITLHCLMKHMELQSHVRKCTNSISFFLYTRSNHTNFFLANLWEKYRIILVFLIIGLLILGVIVYMARRRNPQVSQFSNSLVVFALITFCFNETGEKSGHSQ